MVDSSKPNILIIIADSLRADFLSCYGGRVPTQNIDQVASSGIKFENAYSQGPQSAVSHASMFTGRYPSNIGVTRSPEPMKDTTSPTIAGWLRDHGYRTFGIAGPGKMSSEYGYDRGFDDYYESYNSFPDYLSTDFLKAVITEPRKRKPLLKQWVRTATRGVDEKTGFKFDYLQQELRRSEKPFFGVMNTTVTHYPYNPPRPYKTQENPETMRSKYMFIDYLLREDVERAHPVDHPDVRPHRLRESATFEGRAKYASDPSWLNEAELDVLRDWYAGTIRYFDEKIGEFMNQVEDIEDTLVIITGDHGEHFGEHGVIQHGWSWFDECHRVPLIFSDVDTDRLDSGQYASLIDLFPSICDLVDIPIPEQIDGESLFRSNKQFSISEIDRVGNKGRDLLDDEHWDRFSVGRKYIRNDDWLYVLNSDGTEEWYRRPSEQLVSNNESGDEELKQILLERIPDFVSSRDENPEDIPDDLKSNLEDLGYL
jgi:arylsulfatase A-like enzyme